MRSACAALLLAALLPHPGAAADLPRLAGIVIAPGARVALFDTGQGGLTQADEGDDLGGFRVRSIGPAGVRLERDGRTVLLAPSPASAPVRPADDGGATFGLVLRGQPPTDD